MPKCEGRQCFHQKCLKQSATLIFIAAVVFAMYQVTRPTNETKSVKAGISSVPSKLSSPGAGFSKSLRKSLGKGTVPTSKFTTTRNVSATLPTMAPIRHYIVGKIPNALGRLGNRMFVYASLYGIARSNRMAALYDDNVLRHVFLITAGKPSDVSALLHDSSAAVITEKAALRYDKSLTTLSSKHKGHVRLYGYLQSWKYFKDLRSEIQREFTFRSEHNQVATSFLRNIASKYRKTNQAHNAEAIFIGVHIRRRDMLGDAKYTVADDKYLEAAVRYMNELFPKKSLIYVVCSDDANWSKEHFSRTVALASKKATSLRPVPAHNFTDPVGNKSTSVKASTDDGVYFNANNTVVFSQKHTQGQDLAILAACNHTIMTVGTYGWWAGYLAGGVTIYYKNFPSTKGKLSRIFSRADFFPPNWIGL